MKEGEAVQNFELQLTGSECRSDSAWIRTFSQTPTSCLQRSQSLRSSFHRAAVEEAEGAAAESRVPPAQHLKIFARSQKHLNSLKRLSNRLQVRERVDVLAVLWWGWPKRTKGNMADKHRVSLCSAKTDTGICVPPGANTNMETSLHCRSKGEGRILSAPSD